MNERIAVLWRRLLYLMRRRQFDTDLEAELDFHLSMKESEAESAGLLLEDARFAARRDMGNLSQAREGSREAWTFVWLEQWYQDTRHTLRILARSPVFTISAVLTLAFGIGANTAIFTLIDALLLRSLPIPEPSRVMQVVLQSDANKASNSMSYPMFEDIRDRIHSFSGLFTWYATDLSLGWGADARPLVGAVVSGQAFQTLGISAQAGRLFVPSDDTPGAPFLVVISDAFWNREYGRDPAAIGRKLLLNQQPFTVAGILPRSFLGVMAGTSPDVIIALHSASELSPGHKILQEKSIWFLSVLGRLKPGIREEQAGAELSVISPMILKAQIASDVQFWENGEKFVPAKLGLIPAAGSSLTAQRWRQSLWILMSISGLVLLLACVNLASLALARIAARKKELAMRLALGARRSRIIRQLLTESLLLSLTGAALGMVLAIEATRALILFLSNETTPLVLNLHPDWRVLSFTGAIAMATGLLIGSVPALGGTELSPNDALKQTRIGLEQGSHKFGFARALVTTQVGLAVVLVAVSVLFVRTLQNARSQDLGFDRTNIVFASLNSTKAGLKQTQLAQLYTDLLQRLRRIPQVSAASLTQIVPMEGAFAWTTLNPELWPSLTAHQRMLYTHDVTPQYFQTLGLKLRQGRDFVAGDSLSPVRAGILSKSAAKTFFPNQNPVGQLLRVDQVTSYRIIGEVEDAKYATLREAAPNTIYTKLVAAPFCHLAIRGGLDRAAVVRVIRDLLRATGKDIRLSDSVAMVEQIDRALTAERLIAMLASFYALLAVVLVAIGLFGTVSYSASRRTSEIGVRLALGSTRKAVFWLVLREALIMSTLGLIAGIPTAIFTAHVARSLLFGVVPYDPFAVSATAGLIVCVTITAAFLPALRASQLEPMRALRCD